MSYSAAALSFILEDLGKPVIFTGAQKPMAEMRSDAIDNLQGATNVLKLIVKLIIIIIIIIKLQLRSLGSCRNSNNS